MFQLLRDEIDLRWKGEIEPYLRGLTTKSPIEGLQLLSTMELKGDDVFILKAVSASFADYFFIGNYRLVSQLVHGYLVVCDLIDFKSFVARMLSERHDTYLLLRSTLSEQEAQQQLSERYQQFITKLWDQFPRKLDAISQRFDKILPQLPREG